MKVGFSGPRTGMTDKQAQVLLIQLQKLGATQLHHGDCKGADQRAHEVARALKLHIVGHPPTSSGMRAFCQCDELRPVKPFLARNHNIVQSTQVLVTTPDRPEHLRSGTWSTIRYAARLQLPRMIIRPDGSIIALDLIL